MALLAGAMCGVRNDSCSHKHKYARTSHEMASESLSRGVDIFFSPEFCFLKQEHGPPRGSKQAKTGVLLTTVLGSLRCDPCGRTVLLSHITPFACSVIANIPTLPRTQMLEATNVDYHP